MLFNRFSSLYKLLKVHLPVQSVCIAQLLLASRGLQLLPLSAHQDNECNREAQAKQEQYRQSQAQSKTKMPTLETWNVHI